MKLSLIFACFWVIASTIVAFLPMRRQYFPVITLLIAAPILIVWVGYDYGWWLSAIAVFALLSMFRNPLRYIWKLVKGEKVELPK